MFHKHVCMCSLTVVQCCPSDIKVYNRDMNMMSTDTKLDHCDMNVLHDDMKVFRHNKIINSMW